MALHRMAAMDNPQLSPKSLIFIYHFDLFIYHFDLYIKDMDEVQRLNGGGEKSKDFFIRYSPALGKPSREKRKLPSRAHEGKGIILLLYFYWERINLIDNR
jgi:hypothetical protein